MGRKPKKKSSFLTLVTDNFLNKFCVPQPFLKNFTDEIIPKEVYFKRSMKCWVVKLEKIENKLYFRKGLKIFLKENNIEKGDYIVFTLLRGSVFKFTIYDQTFCEKQRFNKIIIPQVNTVGVKSAKLLSGMQNVGRNGCDHVNAKGKKLEGSPDDPISSKCRYFKLIFCQDQAPDFPEWFIEKLEELKCVVNVKVRCGEYSELELTKVDNKILLRGWKSFLAKNSIRDGQPLKFKYVLPSPENDNEAGFEEGRDYLVSEEELGAGCSGGGGSKEVFGDGSEEPSMTEKERSRIYYKPSMKATKSIKISENERVKKKHYTNKKSLGMHSAAENVFATASTSKPSSNPFLDFPFLYFIKDLSRKMYHDEDKDEDERMSIEDTHNAPYLDELKRSGNEYTENLLAYIKELALGTYNEFDSGVSINNGIDKTITAEKPRRPLNAYMIFMEKFRTLYVIKYPKSAAKDDGIAGGEKWRSMTDAERAPYIAESKKRTAEYKKQLKAFNDGRAVGSDINDGAVLYNSESEVNKNGKKERTCKEDKGNCYQSESEFESESESESDSKMVYESISSEEENTDEDSDSYNSISAYDSDDNGEETRSDDHKPIKELASKEHKAITPEKIKFRNTYTTEYPNSQAKENGIAGGEKWRSMTKSEKVPSFSSFLKAQNGKYYKHPDSERTMKHDKRKATKSPGNKPKRPANQYFGFHGRVQDDIQGEDF